MAKIHSLRPPMNGKSTSREVLLPESLRLRNEWSILRTKQSDSAGSYARRLRDCEADTEARLDTGQCSNVPSVRKSSGLLLDEQND